MLSPADPCWDVLSDPLVPATPDVFPDRPVGEPLGDRVGDEVVGGDDGLWSAVGDGFAVADRVPLGLGVLDELAQLVGVGVPAARLLALAAVEVEMAVVAVPVAVEAGLGLALLLGGVCGLVSGLLLGLPLDGLFEGLTGGGVDWVLDWLGPAGLGGVGVPAAAGLGERQDEPCAGVRCPELVLVAPTPPPLGWPAADPGAGDEELVVPEPATVAVSGPIECRSGGTASTTAMANTTQAMPRAGRSSASRQSPSRPRRPRRRVPEPPERPCTNDTNEAKERLRARAGADLTRARMRSRPSGRGSIWSAMSCSSRRRNSGKSRPGSLSGPWPGRVITPAPGRRGGRPCRGPCGS